MCYDKNNNHMFTPNTSGPDMINDWHRDTINAFGLLKQLKALPQINNVLTPGERASIDEICKRLMSRRNSLRLLQADFE